MPSVFFYGLFMDEDLLKEKGICPTSAALGLVNDFELRIGNRATLVKKLGFRSYGLIADLNEDELLSLYSDQSVADYEPIELEAEELNGVPRTVISYLLPTDKLSGANNQYAIALAKVAAKLGFPQTYIKEIESWVSKNA